MKSIIEWNRMMEGKLYNPYKVGDDSWENIREALKLFNESKFWKDSSALENLKQFLGSAPDDLVLTPPVYFDHGDRIFLESIFMQIQILLFWMKIRLSLVITFFLHRMLVFILLDILLTQKSEIHMLNMRSLLLSAQMYG